MRRHFRRIAALLRRTPLHPQWLLGARAVPQGLAQARGLLLDVGAADRWLEGRLAESQTLAIVGGGWIGLEIAASARKSGAPAASSRAWRSTAAS